MGDEWEPLIAHASDEGDVMHLSVPSMFLTPDQARGVIRLIQTVIDHVETDWHDE